MDLEEQILHYYLKVLSKILIISFVSILIIFFSIIHKTYELKNKNIEISKGENIKSVFNKNIVEISIFEIHIISFYYRYLSFFFNTMIHFGDFNLKKNVSPKEILNIISQPSNILNKITIVEGWSKKDLDQELSKYFDDFFSIEYENILADTYYFEKNEDFNFFYEKLINFKSNYFQKMKKNSFFQTFNQKDLLIIGSLLEKEGTDYEDKKKISSVIINRLNKNMKLQIDATVIFALTSENNEFNRKLTFKDLKIDHKHNTYKYKGLPPTPISYVGTKTIEILLENYKTENLFYFYDKSIKKHIFSKNYEDHKTKLNEYRNKK